MLRNLLYNFLNFFSRFFNFFIFWIIINKLGASSTTDWFFFVYGFVYFCVSIMFYALECALVPIWPGLSQQDRNDFLQTCIYLGSISIFGLQIVGLLITLLAPQYFGFVNPFSTQRTVFISMLLFLQPALAFFAALFSSLLQASGHYFWPITHLAWRTLGVLAVLVVPGCTGVWCLAIAYTVGECLRAIVLYYALGKNIIKPVFTKRFGLSAYRKYFVSMGWMALMVCASASNAYIDFIMVGHLGDGNATLVEYAGRLRGLPFLALSGLLVVFLGDWSRLYGTDLKWKAVRKVVWQITACGAVLSVGLILLRSYWVPMIFRVRQFNPSQMIVLTQLMAWYLAGTPFLIAWNVFARGFLVWQYFKFLSFVSLLSVIVNIILNLILINIFGTVGVAMSTTLLDIFMLSVLYFFGKKHVRRRSGNQLSEELHPVSFI